MFAAELIAAWIAEVLAPDVSWHPPAIGVGVGVGVGVGEPVMVSDACTVADE